MHCTPDFACFRRRGRFVRFDVIDGIRGHLLIGMLVAHLSFQPGMGWLVTFHHHALFKVFDAEFFVIVAGFLVGYLADRRIGATVPADGGRIPFARYLGRRVATVFAYHFVSSMALIMVFGGVEISWRGALGTALDIVAFRDSATYSGVLILYILCFSLLLGGVLALGLRPLVLAGFSAAVYLISQYSYISGFWGIGGDIMAFDVAAWQFPFVASFALGYHHRAVGRGIARLPEWGAAAIVIFLFASALWLATKWFTPPLAELPPGVPRHWPRPQLHPYHLLKMTVLAAGFTILLVGRHRFLNWPRLVVAGYFRLRILRNIGRYSIRMFILHLTLVAVFVHLMGGMYDKEKTAMALGMIAFFIAVPTVVALAGRPTARRQTDPEIRP